MANNITKRQHYVWRNYLRAWANDDVIYAYIKMKQDIIQTELMNVAQKRYFNNIEKFDATEEKFLKYTCSKIKGPIKKIVDDLFAILDIYNGVKKIQEEITDEVPKPLEEIEKNGFELLHSEIEGHGSNLIACRKKEDLYFFDNEMQKYKALMYICFQYFRTKKQKDSQIKNFEGTPLDIGKIYNFLAITSAAQVAQNISFDPKIRYCLLEITNNEISFITGDQPVINLVADDVDDEGGAKDLVFYYPISPKHAIKIEFNDLGEKYQHRELSVEEVDDLNKKMINEYHEFIFADSHEQLNSYTQHFV
ncbi:DUF4238 domain-containing protein [Marinifilum flexuosum]|uniref:Uncharacterized protein DUF4238 n=1 Tax=Marinifilum flexuosum TaxID=1117708 RepID=A0A419WF76_9BACT|nr:DUF4238 domain-containing protein [Marinifilum flexuosum]RKD94141.1 uncharacterized protein DUF4238 [Marinifilum flexuosum]